MASPYHPSVAWFRPLSANAQARRDPSNLLDEARIREIFSSASCDFCCHMRTNASVNSTFAKELKDPEVDEVRARSSISAERAWRSIVQKYRDARHRTF